MQFILECRSCGSVNFRVQHSIGNQTQYVCGNCGRLHVIEIDGFNALVGNIKPRQCLRCDDGGVIEWKDQKGNIKKQVCPMCGGTGVEIEKVER